MINYELIMKNIKENKIENEFGKFFYTDSYIKLKNYLFNYLFRKHQIKKSFFKYFRNNILEKNFIIADIGSGISPISPLIEKTVFIELEKEAVDFLKKMNMNAMKGDITNLNLKNNSFDVIICSEVLEHVKDYRRGIAEMYRVVKKYGGIIITVPTHDFYWKDDDEFVGHFRRFNPEILQKNLEEAGFKVLLRKPVGSKLERHLTWLIVKIARTNKSKSLRINKLKLIIFYLINNFLFNLIKIANAFTSEKNSSIILFVVKKI